MTKRIVLTVIGFALAISARQWQTTGVLPTVAASVVFIGGLLLVYAAWAIRK